VSFVSLRILVYAHQAICAVGGHGYLLRVGDGRIFLQCADCGHETPGWRIDAKVGARLRVMTTER
jgi:hypothetical protein